MSPLLRAPAVIVDTWLTRRKLKHTHQGVPSRHDRVGLSARVARPRTHATQEDLARPRRHLPHRLRGPLAVGPPRHRPSPRGERAVGAGGDGPRRQGRPRPRPVGERPVPRRRWPTVPRSARASGLDPRDRAVLVVAGSWGVGDVLATVEAIARTRRVPPDHGVRTRREAASRARDARRRHGDRLDRPDAGADDRGRRAGRERGRPHVHGGVRRRPAGRHLPADRRSRQGQRRGHVRARASTSTSATSASCTSVLRDVTAPGATRDALIAEGHALFVGDPASEVSALGGDELVDRPQGPRRAAAGARAAQDRVDRRGDADRALHGPHPRRAGGVGDRRRRRASARGRASHGLRRRAPRRRAARGRRAHRRPEGARRHRRRRCAHRARPLDAARGARGERRQHRQRRLGPRHVPAVDAGAQRRRPRERGDRA